MIIPELLSGLGFGQQIIVAATVGIFILYLFRGKKAAGRAVGIASSAWLAGVSVLAAIALSILFGWVDPNPANFVNDVIAFIQGLISWGGDVIGETLDHWSP